MHYRSDWPEVGLPIPLSEQSPVYVTAPTNDRRAWVQETDLSGAVLRWIAAQSEFETRLYGFPIWNLHIEVDDPDGNLLTAGLDNPVLLKFVNERARQLSDLPPWGAGYVSAKVVDGEPLYDALRLVGFEEIEHRRAYRCKVRDIASETSPTAADDTRFTSLAAVEPEQRPAYHEQILRICQEVFGEKGYSRHFTDPVLLERLPGSAYILAVMALNFDHVTPSHFLVAVDIHSGKVCGFSAVGRKPGLWEDTYTQLLSAVEQAYRGRGIYRGLTHLLSQTLSPDATLLNITHTNSHAIQRAYQGSGRVHLADTVVLRRVYGSAK